MAPNPIMIPRRLVPRRSQHNMPTKRSRFPLSRPAIAVPALCAVLMTLSWARSWFRSGAGIETALLVYGAQVESRILPDIPLWTILATLNLTYAICSTSWLLHGLFTLVSFLLVVLTTLSQFTRVAYLARRVLRKLLGRYPHLVKDKLALFNLPALEIDTDVDGLFVIRGVTMSLSSLTLVVHGVELGLKLTNDIELSAYADEVTVKLFRRIEIGDVYANVRGGKSEMTWPELDDPISDGSSDDTVFLDDTPLLRAATAGSKGFQDRPKLRNSLTSVSYMEDSSARAGLDTIMKLFPDDKVANKQYYEKLTEIRRCSAVYQARAQVRQRPKTEHGLDLEDEKDMRSAICAELQHTPSIAHPPTRSVRVTTLQNLSPPYVRRFLHRLPFLLRLLLAPLSYFHPISITSINAAGSGHWISAMLQQNIFKGYTDSDAGLRKIHRRVSRWLADANFCLQLVDIYGLGQVPIISSFDIVTYLKFADVMAYRTVPQSGKINQVVRLGGADATFTIPSFLLPHHEHLVPPKPTPEDETELEIKVEDADGHPNTIQAQKELKQVRKDEANVSMSVHVSLPVSCDQSLLNFIAALVKATKIIELEREVEEADPTPGEPNSPTSPISIDDPTSDVDSVRSRSDSRASNLGGLKEVSGFKAMAKNIRQSIRDGTTGTSIKEFAKDLHQSTKGGMKKAAVGGLVNDRWIAKAVGKTAAMLQKAQGDVGYSGDIPVALEGYRGEPGLEGKILP